jgi:hypothetical protein
LPVTPSCAGVIPLTRPIPQLGAAPPDGRLRLITQHLPPQYAARLFEAQASGATERPLRNIAAEGLQEIYFKDRGRRAQGLLVEFTAYFLAGAFAGPGGLSAARWRGAVSPASFTTSESTSVAGRRGGAEPLGTRRCRRVRVHSAAPSGSDQVFQTWNSDICPADQPVFAVTFTRKYRWVVAANVRVTVLLVVGSKV